MLMTLSTNKTVSAAATALQAVVQTNHFGVLQVHNLKETMTKKGVEFVRECLIFEVCQPLQAKKMPDQNMSVSTALPCRNSICEERGKAMIASDADTWQSKMMIPAKGLPPDSLFDRAIRRPLAEH